MIKVWAFRALRLSSCAFEAKFGFDFHQLLWVILAICLFNLGYERSDILEYCESLLLRISKDCGAPQPWQSS